MWSWKKNPKSPFLTHGRDSRRKPRYPSSQVSCALGDVVDLSEGGLGVRCEGKPPVQEGQVFDLWIKSGKTKLSLRAKVTNRRKVGRKEYILGLEFQELSTGMANVLEKLARLGFIPKGGTGSTSSTSSTGPGVGATFGSGGTNQNTNQGQDKAQDQTRDHGEPRLRVGINLPDHYGVLEIPGDASDQQVKAAFRRLAAQFHPDVNKEEGAADRFVAIQQAYEVLRDKKRRREYDAMVFGRSLPCA